MDDIYLKIKKIRAEKKLTQEEVAKRLNMAQSNYTRMERGLTSISIERLKELADIFEMSPQAILSYSDDNVIFKEDLSYYLSRIKKLEAELAKAKKALSEMEDGEYETFDSLRAEIEGYKKKNVELKKVSLDKDTQLKEKEERAFKLEQELQTKNATIEHLQEMNKALLRIIESTNQNKG